MIDPTPAFESITALLRTSVYPVYESEVPEDSEIDYTNGIFTPFLVVYYGGPIRAAFDRSLVSTRNDSTRLTCSVEIYAPRAGDARFIAGRVADLVTGFRPTDSGELTLDLSRGPMSRGSNSVRPTQYIHFVGFSCISNMQAEIT